MTSVAYGLAFPATRGVLAFDSSSFVPTTLFAGDTGGWWDVADMSTLFQDSAGTSPVTAAGQPVGRINDKSGNGNHLLQATGAVRPMLRSGGSLWWLEFDGTQFLQATFTLNQPVTRVSAAQSVAWQINDFLWDGVGAIAGVFDYSANPTLALGTFGSGYAANTDMTIGVNHVVTDIFNGASSKLAIDNNSYTTGNPGGSNPGGATIAAKSNTANKSNILWFGAVWIGRVLTDVEIAQARTYFGARAGLAL